MTHLLIADDDTELCDLLRDYLTREGFEVDLAHDGETAVRKVRESHPALLVLDVMMPRKSGFEVLHELRQHNDLPILMLTARGERIDRVVGLEMGADDYIPKPCDPRELVARIRAVLRRARNPLVYAHNESDNPVQAVLTANDIVLNSETREVSRNGEPVSLTATEFSVLYQLLLHAGKPVGKEALCETCLGRRLTPYDRSIDVHISNLRKKLGTDDHGRDRIKTLRGNGYQYVAV